MQLDTIANMDALEYARTLPDDSVDCVITSPPYYGLRDYGADGQIGLEPTMRQYIERLVTLFAEVRRALKPEGTFWLNLGDSYAGSGKGSGGRTAKQVTNTGSFFGAIHDVGLDQPPAKNLMMIPARVAIALQDAGWIVRQEIIWAKANPMPESVRDRCTRSHEMVYMLTKSPRYYYDADAIAERVIGTGGGNFSRAYANVQLEHGGESNRRAYEIRNKRTVWNVNPQPTPEAHFATFPPKLIEPMILAGCPRGGIVYDPFMGSGTTALVARQLGRHYIGSELNAEYIAIAERRLSAPYTAIMF